MRVSNRRCYYRNDKKPAASSKVRVCFTKSWTTYRWTEASWRIWQRGRTHKQYTCTNAAAAHLSRNDWPFPYLIVYMNGQGARAARRAEVDWQPPRALPAPTCPPPPPGTGWYSKNKTANKGRAANVRAATGPLRTGVAGGCRPGTPVQTVRRHLTHSPKTKPLSNAPMIYGLPIEMTANV